jgi:beta-1,4-mannosyl-glycoprotein beta-1,4-N-acetylglucosaminyltransferase
MFIDCFPYFNEAELLELRVRMLHDHVDRFLIVEANKTHRGEPKEFTCEETIKELGIPSEKISLLKVQLPSIEDNPDPWVRERGQRDALAYAMDMFSDDTVFFVSDCDEILDPEKLDDALRAVSANSDRIVHAPMVFLVGRADRRACKPNKVPYLWTAPYFLINHQRKNQSLSLLRENQGEYFYKDGQVVDKSVFSDPTEVATGTCGWHFSWMGDNTRRQIKCHSFVHCFDYIPAAAAPLNSDEMQNFIADYAPEVGATDPIGRTDHILEYYPPELLPTEAFTIKRARKFLFSDGR